MLGSAAELAAKCSGFASIRCGLAFFLLVGAVNLYVAYSFSEAFWVKFKLFGMLGMTIVFVVIQSIWLTMAAQKNESAQGDTET